MIDHDRDIARATSLLEDEGFKVIPKDRIRHLRATISIGDEVKYLKDQTFDFMEYAKRDLATRMAMELGTAITWTVAKDKYLPCTRMAGQLRVIMP